MKITTQVGQIIEVRAAKVEGKQIICKFPSKNKGFPLGIYKNAHRALDVFEEIWKASDKGDLEFKMPEV